MQATVHDPRRQTHRLSTPRLSHPPSTPLMFLMTCVSSLRASLRSSRSTLCCASNCSIWRLSSCTSLYIWKYNQQMHGKVRGVYTRRQQKGVYRVMDASM